MTKNQVYKFIGMSLNAEKQAEENRKAIVEECGGFSCAAVILGESPSIHVLVEDLRAICAAVPKEPDVTERKSKDYPYSLSVVVKGVKVFAICEALPEWAV